jgi:aprataxin
VAELSRTESRSGSDSSITNSQSSISRPAVPPSALSSLHSLLTTISATTALQVLETLHQTSLEVVEMIKDEMLKTEGFEWGIEVGFHAVPSMR